jgi:archaemetzincin
MERLGPFKRKDNSPSDIWLQKVIRNPEEFCFFPLENTPDEYHEHSRSGKVDRQKSTNYSGHFDRQTYSKWKGVYEMQRFSHPIRMRRRTLVIQPLLHTNPHGKQGGSMGDEVPSGHILDPTALKMLQDFCSAFFCNMDVIVESPLHMSLHRIKWRIHAATNSFQLHAVDTYKYMLRHSRVKSMVTVGVVSTDLYPSEEWNFCLGHASTSEGCGVFSIGHYHDQRLSEDFVDRGDLKYQLSRVWRLIKVMTHETCHMFGMTHCVFFKCLMNKSSSIPEAEGQPLFLCPVCLRKLHKVLKFDIKSRYELILQQLKCLEEQLLDRCICRCPALVEEDERKEHCKNEEVVKVLGKCEDEQVAKKPEAVSKHTCQLQYVDTAIRWLKGQILY